MTVLIEQGGPYKADPPFSMEHRAFGGTGLQVPVVGMGTWQTFDVRGKAADERVLVTDAAFETGATFFDSSPMYGEAERVLGRTLAGRRDRAIVATKVWTSNDAEAEQQMTAALAYFERRVDIYQVHNLVAWRERLSQLQRLQDAGTVRVVGLTHYSANAFGDLLQAMKDPRVQAIQVPYNPLERSIESRILPAAADLGLGVIVMRPFVEGSLLRGHVAGAALAPLAPFGITSWPQALLKWILSDPRCHVAIPATSSPDHLRANAIAGNKPWLGPDEREYICNLADGHRS
jgi:aryl-alcohol dehydrogenase-like predicted oxidoreductase